MKIQAILFFGLLATSASLKTCEESCQSKDSSAVSSCFQDGSLYTSQCIATCANNNNYALFPCDQLSGKDCLQKCANTVALYKCEQDCNKGSHSKALIYCGNQKVLFSNLCKARCLYGDSISSMFECTNIGYTASNCRDKCISFVSCKDSCANAAEEDPSAGYICAADGMIYRKKCEADCNQVQQLLRVPDDGADSSDTCKKMATSTGSFGPKKKQH